MKGPQHDRYEAAKRRREGFLEAIKQGATVRQACIAVGWSSMNTYFKAKKDYPLWSAQIDQARVERRITTKDEQPKTRGRPANFPEGAGLGGFPSVEDHVQDFREFTEQNFPDRRSHLGHQLRIVTELRRLRPREVCLILLWPEAGKTSTIEDYICKTLAEDHDHRFRIVSEAQDLSKRIIGTCARRFTEGSDYPKFIGKYGPFYEKGQERRGRPWTTEQLTILQNSGAERDRSLVASSWTSAVYGSRIDTLIIDDVQSQRNYGQSEEIFRRIRGTFFNRGLEMRTLIVGTRIGPEDFYDRMMEAGLITRKVVLAAADHEGNPTIPEFWDQHTMIHDGGPCCMGFRQCPRDMSRLTAREFMELIRHQSGEDTWWAAYQQQPSADENTSFGLLLDRCKDLDRLVGQLPAGVR